MEQVNAKPTKPEQTEEEKQIAEQAKVFRERLKKAHLVIRAQLPLKIGVHEDVYARYPDVPKEVVDKALKWLTNDRAYQKRMRVGESRVDLDGNEVGEVTEAHVARGRQPAAGTQDAEKAAKLAAEFAVKKPGVRKLDVKRVANEAFGDATGKGLKVSVPISDFARLQDLNTAGKEGVRVRITLQDGSQVTARLNPKSFRKAVETFKAAKGNAVPVISGTYVPSEAEIIGAGLAIAVKNSGSEN